MKVYGAQRSESTSEARREGLVPLQTGLVPSGRREATEAGSRRPNFCPTVLVSTWAVFEEPGDRQKLAGTCAFCD